MLSHLQCGGNSPRAPRAVAYSGDSRMSSNTFRSSSESPPVFSCHCPLAFSPSSHCRRPNGKFARPGGPFLLHPDGRHREPFCEHNLILGDPLSILSGLVIWPMWRWRGIACCSIASILQHNKLALGGYAGPRIVAKTKWSYMRDLQKGKDFL